MDASKGRLPRGGFVALVPELLVQDIVRSEDYWCRVLGFTPAYRRDEQRFVYLEHPQGAQIMLCERSGNWETGPMEPPYGRGVMFQIRLARIDTVVETLQGLGIAPHAGPREVWRRQGDREGGSREIFVLDPDGYLIMLAASIGERSLADD